MKLTNEQLNSYREQGYLFFPNLLSQSEIDTLQAELPALMASTGPEVPRDSPESLPKIVYAPHANNQKYDVLSRLPRLLGVVESLLDEEAYIYQSRVNLKLPLTSDAWSWHQDFTAWH